MDSTSVDTSVVMEEQSFEPTQPVEVHGRRSSILKLSPDKRPSRDSRTVSFNDRYIYKELHQDGTSEITNLFLHQDMDISQMDYVEPMSITLDTTMDMSIQNTDSTLVMGNELESAMDLTLLSQYVMPETTTVETSFEVPNNLSVLSNLGQNLAALDACINKVDEDLMERRAKLDKEMEHLFGYFKHVVCPESKYEFALRIFGLRHGVWLLFKINPDTYPNERLDLKFAVHREDRHLYPFTTWREAVRKTTKEGQDYYLTKFIQNTQKFRRFLRTIQNSN